MKIRHDILALTVLLLATPSPAAVQRIYENWMTTTPEASIDATFAERMATNNAGTATSNLFGQQFIYMTTNIYNVLDYGADMTGVKWSATNLQAAIDAAVAAGGGEVIIPQGTLFLGQDIGRPGYIVEGLNNSISIWGSNVKIKGAGIGRTIIKQHATGGEYRNMIGAAEITNTAITDLTLDANFSTGQHDTTQFHTNNFVWWERIWFKNNLHAEGADVDTSYNVWVTDCVFSDNGGGHIGFGGPPYGGGNWYITGCYMTRGCDGDLGFVEDSAAINVKPHAGQVIIANCVVDNVPVGLTSAASAGSTVTVTDTRFTFSGTANTNVYHSAGALTLNHVEMTATNATGLIILGGNNLTIQNNCYFNGRPLIYLDQKVNFNFIGNYIGASTSGHSLQINGGGFHKIANNTFDVNGYSAVRCQTAAPMTNSIISGNTFKACNLHIDGGSSNNLVANNVFWGGDIAVWGSSKYNEFKGNIQAVYGALVIGTGSSQNYVSDSRLFNVTFSSAQDWVFQDCRMAGTFNGASSLNGSTFNDLRALDGAPYRNTTLTANYTADAVDDILLFNGSLVTNTIPSAVTVKRRKTFTIKNLNATALEVTNSTGAQTFDGALRLSLPQYSTRTIMSDGANWHIIGN